MSDSAEPEPTQVRGAAHGRATTDDTAVSARVFPQLPDYRVIGQLGRGGMGIVYEAEQISLGRRVALKIVPESLVHDAVSVKRFELEARTIARLQHDHIVPIYDVGRAGGVYYYTMRLIDGSGLDRVVRELRAQVDESATKPVSDRRKLLAGALVGSTQRLTDESGENSGWSSESTVRELRVGGRSYYSRIAAIGHRIADALAYAHSEGVIHRDIKPSNLMLDSGGRVWLTDFGLAKTDTSDLTTTGNILGTARFMAPEQIAGNSDARSDIYALGITLYELLSLQPAFRGSSSAEIIAKVRDTEPQSLSSIDSGIPRDLQTIVEKAIHKEPKRRYQDAAELAGDLGLFLEGRPIRARRVTSLERLLSWAKRNPAIAASLSGILMLIIAGLVGTTLAALRFRDLAIAQTKLTNAANDASKLARANAAENRQNLYYAEMKLAADAVSSPSGLPRLIELLDHWIPTQDEPTDLRGFEWYWLDSIARPVRRELDAHDNPLLDWDSRGRYLCRGKLDNEVFINSWPEFELLARATMPGSLHQLQLNPSGNTAAIVTSAGEVRIWDWQSDERRRLNLGAASESEDSPASASPSIPVARAVRWINDGAELAIALDLPDGRCELRVVSGDTWQSIHRISLDEHVTTFGALCRITTSHDDRRLAVSCRQRFKPMVIVFETATWESAARLEPRAHELMHITWHPHDDRVAVITSDSQVLIWTLSDDQLQSVKTETYMQSLNWSPGGDSLMVSGNGAVRLYDDALRLRQIDFIAGDNEVHSTFHPDGTLRLASSPYTGLVVLDPTHQPQTTLPNPAADVAECDCYVDWSPDGTYVATSSEPPLTIWKASTGAPVSPDHQDYSILGQPVGWVGETGFLSHFRDELTLWNGDGTTKRSVLQKPSPGDDGPFHIADLAATGNEILLTAHPEYSRWRFAFWNRTTNTVHDISPMRPGRLHFLGELSPDRSMIAVGVSLRMVVISTTDGELLLDRNMDYPVDCAAWSHDGRFLACGDRGRRVTLFDVPNLKHVATLRGHTAKISALDWSPDGRRLASAAYDQTVRLWDMTNANGRSAIVLRTSGTVRAIEWSPEGKRLATMSQNGTGTIHDATLGYQNEFRQQAAPTHQR